MSKFRVGCVPYLNAKPLVWWFEESGNDSPVQVVYDVPSALPALLERGSVDCALVSCIEALRSPGARVAGCCAIGSARAVKSVRMFSKTPFDQVSSLALDQSSMTSNLLARLLLLKMFRAVPECTLCPPSPQSMLSEHDACVLIGDNGLIGAGNGLYVLDLGDAWWSWTGLPFVWAMWTGYDRLTEGLATLLGRAAEKGQQNLASVVGRCGADPQHAWPYLSESMDYSLGEPQWLALERFGCELLAAGLIDSYQMPERVSADIAPCSRPSHSL